MYCSKCGNQIDDEAVVCPSCGVATENFNKKSTNQEQPQIIINNTNTNTNVNKNGVYGKPKNKWVAFLLCLFLGYFGAHKFYEGKILLGIVYIFTFGIFGIGIIVDLISLLFKPNPYFA